MKVPYLSDPKRSVVNKAVALALIPVLVAGGWVGYMFLGIIYVSMSGGPGSEFVFMAAGILLVIYGVPVSVAGLLLFWLFGKTSPKEH